MLRLTREKIEELLNSPEQELSLTGQDLSGIDLSNLDLNGANLSGADLSGTNLSGANLSGVTYNAATRWPEDFLNARNKAAQAGLEEKLASACEELGIAWDDLHQIQAALRLAGIKPQQLRMEVKTIAREEQALKMFQDKDSQSYRLGVLLNALTFVTILEGD